MNPPPRWLRGTLIVAVFLFVGALLFLSAMDRDLNHDEHQFIAPGVLISREGLLPYRDFPMFHLPNLAFVYAGLDRLTHQPVFSAKAFNALASAAAALLIFMAGTVRRDRTALEFRHFWYALAAVALLLSDQLFTYTAGKTWNHEFPAFLLVAAILAHVRSVERNRWGWAALSGFCVGAAIGTRLTYLPVALAFPVLLVFAPLSRRDRIITLSAWSATCLVALAPSIYFFCTDRERFLYDNLQFPRLRLLDLTDTRAQKTMTWWRKVRYFFKEIVAHSLPLALAFIIAMIDPVLRRCQNREPLGYGILVCTAVLPLTILGCFLPSRYQYQHYFAVAPLLALGIAYGFRSLGAQSRWYVQAAILGLVVLSLSPLNLNSGKRSGGILAYKSVPSMLNNANWFTTRLRADYANIQSATTAHNELRDFDTTITRASQRLPQLGKGLQRPTLTLAPIGVLEAGGTIYPEFATGPFAWRTAGLLDAEKRRRAGLVAPGDLKALLDARPPAAILTGVEDEELEKELVAYAEAHAFTPKPVGKRRTLWLNNDYRAPLR